MINISISIYL